MIRSMLRGALAALSLLALSIAPAAAAASPSWTATGAMAHARQNHQAVRLLDGRVLVIGGGDYSETPLASCEIYDPASGAWSPAGSLATARYGFSADLLPTGKVLVAGGWDADTYFASTESYDPATNAWSASGTMLVPRLGHIGVTLPTGRVLISGGRTTPSDPFDDASGYLGTSESYDPVTGAWTSASPMVIGRSGATAALLAGGLIVATGGMTGMDSGSVQLTTEVFTGAAWVAGSDIPDADQSFTMTALVDGGALLTGGQIPFGAPFAPANLRFDPSTRTWTPTGASKLPRHLHAAARLLDGRVLVCGGLAESAEPTATAETWRPGTGAWSFTASMARARSSHTLTTLANGDALAVGGRDDAFADLSACERYHPGFAIIGVVSAAPLATRLRLVPVTFTANATVSGFSAQDVLVEGGALERFSGQGSRYTAMVRVRHDGPVRVRVRPRAGARGWAAGETLERLVDTVPPTIAIGAAQRRADGSVAYQVSYGGADGITLDASDCRLISAGTASGVVSVCGCGGQQRTVIISELSGDGFLELTIAAGTAGDLAGNLAAEARAPQPLQVGRGCGTGSAVALIAAIGLLITLRRRRLA